MQHTILVFSVTYFTRAAFIPSTVLLCHSAKLFDKYSVPHNQHSLEMYYWGRFFSLSSALEN